MDSTERVSFSLIGLFVLLLGLGQLFLLPPFEGIDETGHFSLIRQIAATGYYPKGGEVYLDQAINEYKKIGPAPYAVSAPYDDNGGLTYPAFFAQPELAAPYQAQTRQAGTVAGFIASEKQNWQEQHPPAYYLLMAPFQKAVEGFSLIQQFFTLRLVSFLLALAGYLIGLWGTLRYALKQPDAHCNPLPLAGRDREGGHPLGTIERLVSPQSLSPLPIPPRKGEGSLPRLLIACRQILFSSGYEKNSTHEQVLTTSKAILLSFALYPILFAQFTPEFARLGNDSLCLFLIGVLWALVLRSTTQEHDVKGNILIGLVLGLGLLTKGFFIPVTAGFAVFALLRLWQGRADRPLLFKRLDDLTLIAAPLLVCGLWYIYKWKATGVFLGHYEYLNAAETASMWQSFLSNLSLESIRNHVFGVLMSWTWAGTSSLGRLHDFLQYPIVLFALWMVGLAFYQTRKKPLADPAWLVVWIMAFFMAGILHHAFMIMTFSSMGGTPGWYLHIMAPPMAFLLATVWQRAENNRFMRLTMCVTLVYCALFLIAALWGQMALFSGCATMGPHKYMAFPDGAFCLSQMAGLIERLGVIAYPHAALVCFAAAFIVLALFLIRFGQKPHSLKDSF